MNRIPFHLTYIVGVCFAVIIIALLVVFAMHLRRWVQPILDAEIVQPILDANIFATEERWCGKCGKHVAARKTFAESAGSWFIVNLLCNLVTYVGFTYVDTSLYCPYCGTTSEEPKAEERFDGTGGNEADE